MSVTQTKVDRDARVVWVYFDGRQDELALNLRTYGLEYVPSVYRGSVGLTFRSGMRDDALAVFISSARTIIDLLTAQRGITKKEEAEFGINLVVAQMCQRTTEELPVQGRELDAWIRARQAGLDGGRRCSRGGTI